VSTTPPPLRVLVVDDEPLARSRLKILLSQIPQVTVVAEADNGIQALEMCTQHQPDLVLLDVAMPGMDGIQTAQHISRWPVRPLVVFCTAYDQHALSAFEAAAVDYLVKPVRAERLAAAIERARTFVMGRQAMVQEPSSPPALLYARMGNGLRLIPLETIFYLQAEEKYVTVYHNGGEELIEQSLRSLEEEFAAQFIRIHRNCLVARRHLLEVRRGPGGQMQAVLRGVARPLAVSRRCLNMLKAELY